MGSTIKYAATLLRSSQGALKRTPTRQRRGGEPWPGNGGCPAEVYFRVVAISSRGFRALFAGGWQTNFSAPVRSLAASIARYSSLQGFSV
ncbi:MAG TPA: hypothetical protein VKU38_15165 [Ktedonobacteraceae bacterium]|nr:hypothetical protein [Ktedonobacteraceae bacterium]